MGCASFDLLSAFTETTVTKHNCKNKTTPAAPPIDVDRI